MSATAKILPGTGRGTMRSMVEGDCPSRNIRKQRPASNPLHHSLRERSPSRCRGGVL